MCLPVYPERDKLDLTNVENKELRFYPKFEFKKQSLKFIKKILELSDMLHHSCKVIWPNLVAILRI